MDAKNHMHSLNIYSKNSRLSETQNVKNDFEEPEDHKFDKNQNSINILLSSMDENNSNALKETKIKLQDSQSKVNVNGQKMGSRRIFTPQFKLQVLESYRSDNDCKGNQRATARKYNIHRRQIQKWLQCESTLRSSVASSNQNMKHQFHNLSHHQSHRQQLTKSGPSLSNSINMNNLFVQHQQALQKSTDSVAIPTFQNSSTEVLTAIIASVGTKTNSSPGTNKCTMVSPLRPTAISSTVISPTVIHPQSHSYAIPYSHASIPLTVLPQHLGQHHLHHHNPHFSYNLHNTITQHSSSAFGPSTRLPDITLGEIQTNSDNTSIRCKNLKYESSQELFTYKNSSFHVPQRNHGILNMKDETEFQKFVAFRRAPYLNFNPENYQLSNTADQDMQSYLNIPITTPIDLSIGPRRNLEIENCQLYMKSDVNNSFLDLSSKRRKSYIEPTSDGDVQKTQLCNTAYGTIKSNEQSELINVVDDEKETPPKRQPKLFKPYLLDEYDRQCNNSSEYMPTPPDSLKWSNSKICFSPKLKEQNEETSCIANFRTSNREQNSFHVGSPNTKDRYLDSPMLISPTRFQCPKGSPVSGYESSSSTYSESNESFACTEHGHFSFRLSMTPLNELKTSDSNVIHKRWLDQESNNASYPPLNNSSIAVPRLYEQTSLKTLAKMARMAL